MRFWAILVFAMLSAGCLDLAEPTAIVYLFNSEDTAVDIRVTDNETCQLGLITALGQNTRSTYDVNATTGGFVCIGEAATKGFPVKPGGAYMIQGVNLVVDPNPDVGKGGGGILETLEAAGREAQGN